MSEHTEGLKQLRDQKKMHEEYVALADTLDRLTSNKDFKTIINDEYLTKEPGRLAIVAGDPNMDAKQQADCLAMALAPGHLKRYFSAIYARGQASRNQLEILEENIAEMLASPIEDDVEDAEVLEAE